MKYAAYNSFKRFIVRELEAKDSENHVDPVKI